MKTLRLTSEERRQLIRILTALALFVALFILDKIFVLGRVFEGPAAWLFPFFLYLGVYLFIGYDVLWRAARNIVHGQILDENFLMCLATLGAFALAIFRGVTGQEIEGFDEACAVLLFYQFGEFFQDYATGKARRSIALLMDIRPDSANVRRGDRIERVPPEQVEVGEIIVINPGEKIPLDGEVVKGASTLDTKALTGESLPREVGIGEQVISGCVNLTSQLEVRVSKVFYDSTVSKILELVENASEQKSKAEHFITRFARFYTPIVVAIALLLAIIPSLITSEWSTWVYRALNFLVVSCPCALVISIPLSFFAGIGAASRYGILIKGSNYLEKFNQANLFVFDKTGTLTKGNFAIAGVFPEQDRDELLRLAAIAEQNSNHPIAKSITSAWKGPIESGWTLTNFPGEGISARKGEDVILCGNEKWMTAQHIPFQPVKGLGTVVYVAQNGVYRGALLIADELKPEARSVIGQLNDQGCQTVMLTGDNPTIAKDVAQKIGLTGYKASLLPQDKVKEVETMLRGKKAKEVLCFVGDGINDAPVLMRSDIGVAMGGVGSDAAIEASDIVLMKDDLRGLSLAKRIAKKTMAIVRENIVFSLAIKIAILLLSALGLTNMWFAVFGDVGVAVLAILNAMRVNSDYLGKKGNTL